MKTFPILLGALLLGACAMAPARDPNVGTVSSAAPPATASAVRAG